MIVFLGKSCLFVLSCVPFTSCCQLMYIFLAGQAIILIASVPDNCLLFFFCSMNAFCSSETYKNRHYVDSVLGIQCSFVSQ